jgi:hypothetical protein
MAKVTDSVESQDKGCPRGAYLGLCEAGLIKGIPAGKYSPRKGKNGQYAVRAHSLLQSRPKLADDKKTLWPMASQSEVKKENGQMDVVLALWKNDLLNTGTPKNPP